MNVDNLNKTYKKYPVTVEDKGWVYGVWYCSTAFKKQEMYGQHPGSYLKRLLALFPDCERWLHAPSGVVTHGHTLDMFSRAPGCPQVLGDVSALPYPSGYFDIVETDPPYGREHEKIYGTPKYPRRKAMEEFRRVLKPGGWLVWLDVRYPSYKRGHWNLLGLIGIITGYERVARVCSIFQKPEEE